MSAPVFMCVLLLLWLVFKDIDFRGGGFGW